MYTDYSPDIAGYTYAADLWCPLCIATDVPYQGCPTHSTVDAAESALESWAARAGIDRTDENTFDSGHFPKIITEQFAHTDCGRDPDDEPCLDRCTQCGIHLGDYGCPAL